jgi:hypothetical protein
MITFSPSVGDEIELYSKYYTCGDCCWCAFFDLICTSHVAIADSRATQQQHNNKKTTTLPLFVLLRFDSSVVVEYLLQINTMLLQEKGRHRDSQQRETKRQSASTAAGFARGGEWERIELIEITQPEWMQRNSSIFHPLVSP